MAVSPEFVLKDSAIHKSPAAANGTKTVATATLPQEAAQTPLPATTLSDSSLAPQPAVAPNPGDPTASAKKKKRRRKKKKSQAAATGSTGDTAGQTGAGETAVGAPAADENGSGGPATSEPAESMSSDGE